jgi:hypothetical protein
MADDLRVATDFPGHRKTRLLIRCLGERAFRALFSLWCYAADNRIDGDLTGMDDDEIAAAADWPDDAVEFVAGLVRVKFLDGTPGNYQIHSWAERQPWIAERENRRDHARELAAMRWEKQRALDPDAARIAERIAARKAARTKKACAAVCSHLTPPDPTSPDAPDAPDLDISKTTSSHPGKPGKADDVAEVFNHWKTVMRKDRAKCPDKRKAIIVRALQSYSVEDCKAAIDGCAKTSFNMGDNDRHQPYNDIELILRDAAHIDRFMEAASGKAVPKSVPAADFRAVERAAEREWQRVMQAGASNDFQKIGFAVAMLHPRTVAALKVIDKDPANAVWRIADIPLRDQLTYKAAFIPAWKASGIPYEVDE